MHEIIDIAKEINPNIQYPKFLDKRSLLGLAKQAEEEAKANNTRPLLITSNIHRTYGIYNVFDISATVYELGYSPRPDTEVLRDTLAELFMI